MSQVLGSLPAGAMEGAKFILECAGITGEEQTVALDKLYKSFTGQSALEAAGISSKSLSLLPGEDELHEKLDFNLPQEQWKWFKVSELHDALKSRIGLVQMGKLLAKLAHQNEQIKVKHTQGVRFYWLPLSSSSSDLEL